MKKETWYKRNTYDNDIDEVEVISSTPHFIMIKHAGAEIAHREKKWTRWAHYFPTRAEAIEESRSILERKVGMSKSAVGYAEKRLAEFKEKFGLK